MRKNYKPRPLGKEYKKKHCGFILNGKRSVCWLWNKSIGKDGYGKCYTPNHLGEHVPHRYYYRKYVREIPEGYEVDHICFTRSCIRPEHLIAKTKKRNCRSRDLRNPDRYGAAAVLLNKQVYAIRKLLVKGISKKVLAERFNVSYATIDRIEKRVTFKGLK